MPKISVIVPVYKVENYLAQCLDSILAQSLEDIEIIVIDEGDKDRCREIIDIYEKLDPRIVAIHEHNGGYGNSVNKGIDIARGKYIGIVESDDIIEPDMYELLYDQAETLQAQITKAPFYYCWDRDSELVGEREDRFGSILAPMMENCLDLLPTDRVFTLRQYPILLAAHPSIWSAIYDAEWLRSTGIRFLSKGAYVDIQFRFQTLMAAERIAWCDDPVYFWRIGNPSSTNAKWNMKAALDRWEFLHAQFKDDPALWEAFAPYMLVEEKKNLFDKYGRNCTAEQRKKIKEYLSLYPRTVITANPWISPEVKGDFLLGNPDYLWVKRHTRHFFDELQIDWRQKQFWQIWLAPILILALLKSGWLTLLWGDAFNTFLVWPVTAVVCLLSLLFALNTAVLAVLKFVKTLRRSLKRMKGR